MLQFSFFSYFNSVFFYRIIQLSNCDVHLKWKWRWSTEFMRILCLFFITCNVTLFNFVKSFYLHRKFSSIFTWILFQMYLNTWCTTIFLWISMLIRFKCGKNASAYMQTADQNKNAFEMKMKHAWCPCLIIIVQKEMWSSFSTLNT